MSLIQGRTPRLHSGWLEKKCGQLGVWQQRFVVIQADQLLSWYYTENVKSGKPEGTLNLLNAKIRDEEACVIALEEGTTHIFLRAPSEESKQEWLAKARSGLPAERASSLNPFNHLNLPTSSAYTEIHAHSNVNAIDPKHNDAVPPSQSISSPLPTEYEPSAPPLTTYATSLPPSAPLPPNPSYASSEYTSSHWENYDDTTTNTWHNENASSTIPTETPVDYEWSQDYQPSAPAASQQWPDNDNSSSSFGTVSSTALQQFSTPQPWPSQHVQTSQPEQQAYQYREATPLTTPAPAQNTTYQQSRTPSQGFGHTPTNNTATVSYQSSSTSSPYSSSSAQWATPNAPSSAWGSPAVPSSGQSVYTADSARLQTTSSVPSATQQPAWTSGGSTISVPPLPPRPNPLSQSAPTKPSWLPPSQQPTWTNQSAARPQSSWGIQSSPFQPPSPSSPISYSSTWTPSTTTAPSAVTYTQSWTSPQISRQQSVRSTSVYSGGVTSSIPYPQNTMTQTASQQSWTSKDWLQQPSNINPLSASAPMRSPTTSSYQQYPQPTWNSATMANSMNTQTPASWGIQSQPQWYPTSVPATQSTWTYQSQSMPPMAPQSWASTTTTMQQQAPPSSGPATPTMTPAELLENVHMQRQERAQALGRESFY